MSDFLTPHAATLDRVSKELDGLRAEVAEVLGYHDVRVVFDVRFELLNCMTQISNAAGNASAAAAACRRTELSSQEKAHV